MCAEAGRRFSGGYVSGRAELAVAFSPLCVRTDAGGFHLNIGHAAAASRHAAWHKRFVLLVVLVKLLCATYAKNTWRWHCKSFCCFPQREPAAS